ncbi:Glycogen synthase [subsurface metagenome]
MDNFYNPNNVIHIIHGIKLDDYFNSGLIEEKKIIKFGYIGYLDDVHKGLGVLLNAIELILEEKSNLNLFFEFCGDGPLKSKLKDLEKKYPEFIKYNGYISNDLISNYYKNLDVFLFSSRREPFPRTLMKALASRLIIISSKTIGSVELLKGKKFGFFVDRFSPEAFKKRILEVYDLWVKDYSKFQELKDSAKEYVFQNYSTSKEIEMFKTLIKKCAKEI